jgi:hypothetical protein
LHCHRSGAWLKGRVHGRLITTAGCGRVRGSGSKAVRRASHAPPSSIQDMGVDHGGLDIVVAEQLLDSADVVAVLDQMRRKGMSLMPGPA